MSQQTCVCAVTDLPLIGCMFGGSVEETRWWSFMGHFVDKYGDTLMTNKATFTLVKP